MKRTRPLVRSIQIVWSGFNWGALLCAWQQLLVFGAAHVTNNEGRTIQSLIFGSQNLFFPPFLPTLSPSGSQGGCRSLSWLHVLLYLYLGVGELAQRYPGTSPCYRNIFLPRDLNHDRDHLNSETFVGLTSTSRCSGQVELNKPSRAPMETLP